MIPLLKQLLVFLLPMRWLTRFAAQHGNVDAQLEMGAKYDRGRGVPQDDAEAAKWFRLAAEQGHVDAQFLMATHYDDGRGVPQDDAEAVKWFRLAAEQGHVHSQVTLGLWYDASPARFATSPLARKNDAEAVKWYRLAAEQGNESGQFGLGVMYATGRGVPQDYAEAVKWYRLAAEQGHESASEFLADPRKDPYNPATQEAMRRGGRPVRAEDFAPDK